MLSITFLKRKDQSWRATLLRNYMNANFSNEFDKNRKIFKYQIVNKKNPIKQRTTMTFKYFISFASIVSLSASLCAMTVETPLYEAVSDGKKGIVQNLLKTPGIDVDARGDLNATPLMVAAGGGNLELVRMLLEHYPDISAKDSTGRNAFFHAAQHTCNVEILRELLNALVMRLRNTSIPMYDAVKEFINAPDNEGYTPLMESIINGVEKSNLTVPKLLLSLKAIDVNAANEHGETALMRAVRVQSLALVAELLNREDIDVNAKNKQEETALKLAVDLKNLPIIIALCKDPRLPFGDQSIINSKLVPRQILIK